MPDVQLDTSNTTVTVKTRRGNLYIGPNHEIRGLWQIIRKEVRDNAAVRRMCGGVTRQTLLRWRTTRDFPAPEMTLKTNRGTVELWSRTTVEHWWRAYRQDPDGRRAGN